MYRLTVTLEGIAPLLMNGWSAAALDALESSKTGGKKTTEERHQEALGKLYAVDAEGNPVVPDIPNEGRVLLAHVRPPAGAIKQAIVTGCSRANLKEGRTSLGTYLEATLFPDPEAEFAPVEVYMHRVWGRIPPRTGKAAIIRRPALVTGWQLPLRLTVTDDNRSPERVIEALGAAGLLVGIGSWRPEYGRFVVADDWKAEAIKPK